MDYTEYYNQKIKVLTFNKVIFYLFLMLLVWMPLPVASNRVWLLSISETWLFCLAIFLLFDYWRGKLEISEAYIKAKPFHILFFVYLMLLFFTIIPIPLSFIEFLSPTRAASIALLNNQTQLFSLTENFHESLSFFIESVFYYLVFCFTLLLMTNQQRLKILAWLIIYSALFQAMYGSVMTLSGIEYGFFLEKTAYRGVATGTFINRNHLAGYLNMGIAVGVGLLVAGLGKEEVLRTARQVYRKTAEILLSKKAQLRVYIALSTVALVLTHSRMGNTAFFISLTITALLALKLTNHARRMMLILVISIIVIDVFILSAWFGLEKVAQRLEKTSLQTEQRDEVASYTYKQWQDYFVVGSGGGTYQYLFPKYRGYEIKSYYDHAHNDVLEFASETGVIGITLLISLVLLSLYTAIKALSLRREPLMIGLAFTATMAILALSIHSFVDFNLQIPANAATFMVILALAWIARFHSFR